MILLLVMLQVGYGHLVMVRNKQKKIQRIHMVVPEITMCRLSLQTHLDVKTHCLLYTSDAADERSRGDLGGRRIIKKKNKYKLDGGCRYVKNHK